MQKKFYKNFIIFTVIFTVIFFNIKAVGKHFIKKLRYSINSDYIGETQDVELNERLLKRKDSLDVARYLHKHHRASGYSFLLGTLIKQIYTEDTCIFFPIDESLKNSLKLTYCIKSDLVDFYIYPQHLEDAEYDSEIDREQFGDLIKKAVYDFETPIYRFYFLETEEDKAMAVYVHQNNMIISPYLK